MKRSHRIQAQHGVSTPRLRRRARRTATAELPSIDGWRMTHLAGSGATADVYFAQPVNQSPEIESDYALKVLRSDLASDKFSENRLRHEFMALQVATHPNLVSVLSANLSSAPLYLLLPRLRGATLDRVLAAEGSIDVPRSLWIARQTAEALGALHAAGWMHLDVKPANIAADPSGHCTLFDLDLGLPIRSRCDGAKRDSSENCLRGTLEYTAPELLTSSCSATPSSDVYSLGVVLYQMLAGQSPFGCLPPNKLVEAHRQWLPPSPRTFVPTIPVDVSRLVTRMLAKHPDRRPATSGELQDELARLEIQNFSMRGIPTQAIGMVDNETTGGRPTQIARRLPSEVDFV